MTTLTDETLEATAFADDLIDPSELELESEVVHINRVAKVVKGGRRFSFCAMMVAGDRKGHVGIGYGKANSVPEAIRKAGDQARRNLIYVPLKGTTIPHLIVGEYNAARILMRPAAPGTGVIAGGGPRFVLEFVGIHDILCKNLGSSNIINVVKATFQGLKDLRDARHVAALRGKTVEEMVGRKFAAQLADRPGEQHRGHGDTSVAQGERIYQGASVLEDEAPAPAAEATPEAAVSVDPGITPPSPSEEVVATGEKPPVAAASADEAIGEATEEKPTAE